MSPLNQVYFDRSRTAQDDACPRSRYWGVEFSGIGLEPQGSSDTKYYLPFGSAIHLGMEMLGKGLSPREAFHAALESLSPVLSNPFMPEVEKHELRTMLAGFVIGYGLTVHEQDIAEYDLIAVEAEVVIDLPGGKVVAKPDRLMRRKSDKTPWYKEFKSTSSASEGWAKSWARAAQLLTGALAVEKLLGEPLHGSIIQGLYKGGKYKGRSSSPFCVAYRTPDGEFHHKWAKGREKVPTWELPMPIEEWIESFPPELVFEQFPSTPPIMFNRAMMDLWIEERMIREKVIANVRSLDLVSGSVLKKVFPMHTGGCESAYGSPCPFIGLCYNPQGAAEPLSHGYTWRQPHLASDPAHQILEALG